MSKNRVGFWYLTRGFDPKNMSGYVTTIFVENNQRAVSYSFYITTSDIRSDARNA